MSFSNTTRGRQSVQQFYQRLLGRQGLRGQPGTQGIQGEQGEQGPPGEPGETGPAGENDTRTIKVFTGSFVNNGDEAEHLIYTQTNHRGSIVDLTLLAHDVNSNTFYRYYQAKTYWTRSWTNPPTKIDLITPIEAGTGEPYELVVDYYNDGNDIKFKFTHNISISTVVRYKIIAKIMDLSDVE